MANVCSGKRLELSDGVTRILGIKPWQMYVQVRALENKTYPYWQQMLKIRDVGGTASS